MSEAKFTPGPWKAVPDTTTRFPEKVYMVVGPSEVYVHDDGICRFDTYNGRSFEEDKANMQLIAAAPEMYEALEWLEVYAKVQVERFPMADDSDGWKKVLSSLAKARGE